MIDYFTREDAEKYVESGFVDDMSELQDKLTLGPVKMAAAILIVVLACFFLENAGRVTSKETIITLCAVIAMGAMKIAMNTADTSRKIVERSASFSNAIRVAMSSRLWEMRASVDTSREYSNIIQDHMRILFDITKRAERCTLALKNIIEEGLQETVEQESSDSDIKTYFSGQGAEWFGIESADDEKKRNFLIFDGPIEEVVFV